MSLFEDFLRFDDPEFRNYGHIRTADTPNFVTPFSRRNIEAGLVLADGLEERGRTEAAERLRRFIAALDRDRRPKDDDEWARAADAHSWQLLYPLIRRNSSP